MFADAVDTARAYTLPLVISHQTSAGECAAAVGTYVVINSDGWFVTVAHMFGHVDALQKSHDGYLKRRKTIEDSEDLPPKERQKVRRGLGTPPANEVQNFSLWWGRDGAQVADVSIQPEFDLAVGRFTTFDPGWITTYPVVRDPSIPLRQGTSLCRLGFPFADLDVSFAEERGFTFQSHGHLALFPIDGIFTREILKPPQGNTAPVQAFIETSSPGLKGQSGGPIIDAKGVVWGIQSSTRHLSLGFDPPAPKGGVEHQFLNTGWGVHTARVTGLLDSLGIQYSKGS